MKKKPDRKVLLASLGLLAAAACAVASAGAPHPAAVPDGEGLLIQQPRTPGAS